MGEYILGTKIKNLRIKNGLTQEELANRAELSKGFISQVESDQTSPSISTLVDILDCLGTTLQAFFNEQVEEKIVFSEEEAFVKEDPESGHSITWVIPNSQKNDMEPILLTLGENGRSPIEEPHSGEEYGYVMSGRVRIIIGKKVYRAKKGESFYFSPDEMHYIENAGKTKAEVLWVVSPPSF